MIRQQNFKKNPHTARFLMAFHDAHGANNTGGAAAGGSDLLELVEENVDVRTPGQRILMDKLVRQITALDAELGARTAKYVADKSEAGAWQSPARGGDVSAWISKMIEKAKELEKAVVPVAKPTTGTAITIPAGRYAITEDEIKCYVVSYGAEHGRWAGFTFLSRISSDDEFPIRNAAEKARILDAIREDVAAAELLAALTLRKCRACGRRLSDTKNPYFAQGLGPDCGSK